MPIHSDEIIAGEVGNGLRIGQEGHALGTAVVLGGLLVIHTHHPTVALAAEAAFAAFHVAALAAILELITTVRADAVAQRLLLLVVVQDQVSLLLRQLA